MTAPPPKNRDSAARRTVLIAGGGTGGHLMPALAIAAALRSRHPDWRIVMVGAERGVEAQLLPTRDFPFHLLPFEPIYRRQWWRNARWPWLALTLLRRCGRLLTDERPDLVLGTGGYASGPIVWAAARRGIPTAILEQDAFPGLVTRWLAPRVREVFLGAPEAARHLRGGPRTTVTVTGSPIAPPTPERAAAARARFGIEGGPVVLVMGGSQGSVAINERIAGWIDGGGADRLTVIWATGRASAERFRRYHRPPRVTVVDFLDPAADGYAVADLVVARAGMMTIAEICAWGLPSILIPLPTAAADHQTRNAEAMAAAGAAVMLRQADVSAESLGAEIARLLADPAALAALRRGATGRGRPRAVDEIVDRLDRLSGTTEGTPVRLSQA
ncbi:MAG: undecaprenyldiphospho-muramoylpentapeptide beta-N-acetylglucosaminyltransferase [Gemmatimonadetes bacterium]|nr:undecaprenyldiphospho-muramoylpentapeptide beta-N-acetylglucosaminyltransferase [Gemmatimonadota bacterium]